MPTAVAKISSVFVTSFTSVVVFYGSILLLGYLLWGFGDLTRSIQSLPMLMHSTLKINVLEYLRIFLAAKWASILVVALIVLLVSIVFRTNWVGYFTAVAILGVNLAVRLSIPAISTLAAFKYFNCISMLNTNELLGAYFNINISGNPVSRTIFEFTSIFFLLCLLSAIIVICYCKYTKSVSKKSELKNNAIKNLSNLKLLSLLHFTSCAKQSYKAVYV